MTKRGLTSEDIQIWQQITRRIERLSPEKPAPKIQPAKAAPIKKQVKTDVDPIKAFKIGEKAKPISQKPSISVLPADRSPNMDRKNFQRLMKGKFEIEATLDLHGMTADQAKMQLISFISRSHKSGYRMILVITGKGKRKHKDEFNRERGGILRQSLPDWVLGSSITDKVLQVTHAQPKHGGTGAYYVYLRRRRG